MKYKGIELKAFSSERIYWAVEQVERLAGDIDELHLDDNMFYLKSEADEVIRHQKYKRCLAMAKWCNDRWILDDCLYELGKTRFYERWENRWLKLAEKFKEAKCR